MFIVKHAVLNSLKNKIVGIGLFILLLTTVVTVIIYTTAGTSIEKYTQKFGKEVILTSTALELQTMEQLTKEQYLTFGDSTYLETMKLIGILPMRLKEQEDGLVEKNQSVTEAMVMPTILYGLEKDKIEEELRERQAEVTQGTSKLGLNEYIVNKAFAKANNLQLGQIYTFLFENEQGITSKSVQLKLTGIYQVKENEEEQSETADAFLSENSIYISLDTVAKKAELSDAMYWTSTFRLQNADEIDSFEKELHGKGLGKDYTLAVNDTRKQMYTSPLSEIRKIAQVTFFVSIVFIGLLIGISQFQLSNNKKEEFMVLRAFGMSKKQLFFYRMTELFILTSICLTSAFVIGGKIARPLLEWLVAKKSIIATVQMSSFMERMSNLDDIQLAIASDIKITTAGVLLVVLIGFLFWLMLLIVEGYCILKIDIMNLLLERKREK